MQENKQKQLNIIQKNNKMQDDYHMFQNCVILDNNETFYYI